MLTFQNKIFTETRNIFADTIPLGGPTTLSEGQERNSSDPHEGVLSKKIFARVKVPLWRVEGV